MSAMEETNVLDSSSPTEISNELVDPNQTDLDNNNNPEEKPRTYAGKKRGRKPGTKNSGPKKDPSKSKTSTRNKILYRQLVKYEKKFLINMLCEIATKLDIMKDVVGLLPTDKTDSKLKQYEKAMERLSKKIYKAIPKAKKDCRDINIYRKIRKNFIPLQDKIATDLGELKGAKNHTAVISYCNLVKTCVEGLPVFDNLKHNRISHQIGKRINKEYRMSAKFVGLDVADKFMDEGPEPVRRRSRKKTMDNNLIGSNADMDQTDGQVDHIDDGGDQVDNVDQVQDVL